MSPATTDPPQVRRNLIKIQESGHPDEDREPAVMWRLQDSGRVVQQCANEGASPVTPSVTPDTYGTVASLTTTHAALNALAALPELPNKF